MSIVSDYELYDFVGKDDSSEEYTYYTTVRDAVEDWVQGYCGRTFESTTYKERFDGGGSSRLFLDNYPITSIERVAIGKDDIIRVHNTGTYTHATVSVTTTGVLLTKDGSTTTLLFANYATMTLLIAAINAQSGWYAVITDSSYDNYASTELIPVRGLYCLNSTDVYLSIPWEAESDFDVDDDKGIITLYGFNLDGRGAHFPAGKRNIFVYYTAGYTSTTMPEDLKHAIKTMSKLLINNIDNNTMGVRSYMTGRVSVTFDISPDFEFPKHVMEILSKYRRINI